MDAPWKSIDTRTRNLWIVAAASPFVFGGLLFVLFAPYNGWLNATSAAIPVGVSVKSFVKVCSSTMRRKKFDTKDVAGFGIAALVMLAGVVGGFAVVFRQFGLQGAAGVDHDPWTCLYFSVITWTTVGYGDVSPSTASRPFAALEAMIGYIFMALLTAAVVHIVTKFQPPPTVSGAALIGAASNLPAEEE